LATVKQSSNRSFSWQVRVYYEDTDAGGVVYHSQYLNFMERGRTEWLRQLGFEQTYLRDEQNVVIVVYSAQLDFKKPAKFNDLLTITSEVVKIGRSSFEVTQTITIESTILVQGLVKLACVNPHTFRPVAIPSEIITKMEQL
jgi:acyl-CoA thioester hydrolase